MQNPEALHPGSTIEENFIEQAEYLEKSKFLALATEHPDEDAILRKLSGGGAKLLIGPRGCGKSTLMLKAYYSLLEQEKITTLPIYVNFKLALKLEPLYTKGSNAPFWFKKWLSVKTLQAVHKTLDEAPKLVGREGLPSQEALASAISILEAGAVDKTGFDEYSIDSFHQSINYLLSKNDINRCILLIDDAAHAFSEKQQEDFFDFFRAVKSKSLSPKAAIYPGVTSHSPSFHVGHDAERIDVWVKPSGTPYESYMINMALRRFGDAPLPFLEVSREDVCLLAYAAFGIPRAFLGMIRSICDNQEKFVGTDGRLQRRKVIELARQGRDMSHATFQALDIKLASYRNFIESGAKIYQNIVSTLKQYNQSKALKDQGLQIGIKTPIRPEIEKILGFLQYSGLVMPAGETMRGIKGTFELYDVHIGDLIVDNAIVGRRTKTIGTFLEVLRATKHQAWPRISCDNLIEASNLGEAPFALRLPQCQSCGAERPSEHARFCPNCGAQLKSASTFEKLVAQDISILPISDRILKRIKENSQIRKVRDILIDTSREQLRGIKYIGEIRATNIISAAEEHVS